MKPSFNRVRVGTTTSWGIDYRGKSTREWNCLGTASPPTLSHGKLIKCGIHLAVLAFVYVACLIALVTGLVKSTARSVTSFYRISLIPLFLILGRLTGASPDSPSCTKDSLVTAGSGSAGRVESVLWNPFSYIRIRERI